MNVKVTDEMVDRALAAWCPGGSGWEQSAKDHMRAAIEAALKASDAPRPARGH